VAVLVAAKPRLEELLAVASRNSTVAWDRSVPGGAVIVTVSPPFNAVLTSKPMMYWALEPAWDWDTSRVAPLTAVPTDPAEVVDAATGPIL
jgi:hypothetical protein